MKAAIAGYNGVELHDLPKPTLGPNDVLIRVAPRASIAPTCWRLTKRAPARAPLPFLLALNAPARPRRSVPT